MSDWGSHDGSLGERLWLGPRRAGGESGSLTMTQNSFASIEKQGISVTAQF